MKYMLGITDGRNEPIKDLENAKRVVLVNKNTVGAEDITFAYCRFEAETSYSQEAHSQGCGGSVYLYTVGERD